MTDVPNYREGPQARKPYKFVNGQSYGERLAKEAFWSPATRGSKKDSERATTPAAKTISVPTHLVSPGSVQANQLYNLHAQHSVGQSCHMQKRLMAMHSGLLQSFPTLCVPVDCGLTGFSVRGILQARILEYIGHYWLPYTSKTLYFLLP